MLSRAKRHDLHLAIRMIQSHLTFTRSPCRSQCLVYSCNYSFKPLHILRASSAKAPMSSNPVPPASDAPWYASMPEPQATCETIENSEVMQLLEKVKGSSKHEARNFLLVDVRRNDWDGGTIATSINLPAQSFYQTRPIVYQLCKQAGITSIFFYCGNYSKPLSINQITI